MSITFKFKEYPSNIFGITRRPVAEVYFQHKNNIRWLPITMVVDSGADYTLLPKFLALSLGISLSKDCRLIETRGVGGESTVYLLKRKIRVRLGEYERAIPVGFLGNNHIPPLLGRQEFLETFKVIFEKFQVIFE
ncbi:retroviral-like aspartic protease family protein [Candidatus Daviesbacteria bacterium]|nr:retroviral-like aspartic protease family protein [Candidatus Daviesbacteria bacterium]